MKLMLFLLSSLLVVFALDLVCGSLTIKRFAILGLIYLGVAVQVWVIQGWGRDQAQPEETCPNCIDTHFLLERNNNEG
jgi:hypothetical protein